MLLHFFSQEVVDILAPIIVMGGFFGLIALIVWLGRGDDSTAIHNWLESDNNDDWNNPQGR